MVRKLHTKKVKKLHERIVFEPVKIELLTQIEWKRAMESLIFFTKKKDGRVKSRACANGSTQRSYIPYDDASIPTAA